MQRDARAYLWDVRDAADRVAEFVDQVDLEQYRTNAMVRSAVERQLEIIGEALNQLSSVEPEAAAKIPELRQTVGLRNILIHGYATVDDALVWQTARTNVPALRARVDELLQARS